MCTSKTIPNALKTLFVNDNTFTMVCPYVLLTNLPPSQVYKFEKNSTTEGFGLCYHGAISNMFRSTITDVLILYDEDKKL